MGRFVEGADRFQVTFLPECLDDWVGDDNPRSRDRRCRWWAISAGVRADGGIPDQLFAAVEETRMAAKLSAILVTIFKPAG